MRRLRIAGVRRGGEQGFTLIETIAALGLLAFIAVGFLNGLWTISHNTLTYDERATALVLAQSQIEELKSMTYDPAGSYPATVTSQGYAVSLSTVLVETGKQEVTVDVSHDGRGVLKMTTVKTDWQ